MSLTSFLSVLYNTSDRMSPALCAIGRQGVPLTSCPAVNALRGTLQKENMSDKTTLTLKYEDEFICIEGVNQRIYNSTKNDRSD